jgi:flagellin
MAQVVNTNILSLNAQRNLNSSQGALATSLERLSSGLRINSAKDDAAGLAISERFTTQIRGLNQAVRNANDGISFAQTTEGALTTVGDALQRIRELAVQSANDTNSASDRQALNNEVRQLIAEVNRVSRSTQFNGQNILDDSTRDLVFQVGANAGQTITVTGVDARGSQLGAAVNAGESFTATNLSTAVGQALTLNGTAVDISTATTQSDVIAAINAQTENTGVSARAEASTVSPAFTYGADADNNRTLILNGASISIAAGTSAADAAARINDFASQTGVRAVETGGSITLSNNDGAEVTIADASPTAVLGVASETVYSGIQLVAEVGTTITPGGAAAGTLNLGTTTANSVLNDVNVLTRQDATETLATVDFALDQISGLRAELGAVQLRFESTISNLSISVENLSAARSRIRDADFAAETAELTRSQILQQAGISVLAQANATPQSVLALLQ